LVRNAFSIRPYWFDEDSLLVRSFNFERASTSAETWKAIVSQHYLDCHDGESQKGSLNLDTILDLEIGENSDHWEQVLQQLQARQ